MAVDQVTRFGGRELLQLKDRVRERGGGRRGRERGGEEGEGGGQGEGKRLKKLSHDLVYVPEVRSVLYCYVRAVPVRILNSALVIYTYHTYGTSRAQ